MRLVVAAETDPAQLASEIVAVLRPAGQFLGRAGLTVEIGGPSLDEATMQAVFEAMTHFPDLTLSAIVPQARPASPRSQTASEPKIVRGTIRSGQEVSHQGDLVLLGDVNTGGRLMATGDVIVVGALRGMAWAGAEGDEDAIIYAQPLTPTQVRIAHVIAAGTGTDEHNAEYAHIEDNSIVVESWTPRAVSGRRRGRRGAPVRS